MLDADIASLHLHRGRYAEATDLFVKLCNRYQRAGWRDIEIILRLKLAECQKSFDDLQPYIDTCLYLLQEPELLQEDVLGRLSTDLVSAIKDIKGIYIFLNLLSSHD